MNKQRDIECWSCHADVLLSDREDADGDCPRCGVELALDDYLIAALNKRDALAADNKRLREALERIKRCDTFAADYGPGGMPQGTVLGKCGDIARAALAGSEGGDL